MSQPWKWVKPEWRFSTSTLVCCSGKFSLFIVATSHLKNASLKKKKLVRSHLLHLHSLFELISGSSDWLCISSFDLISFLVQQFLRILLRPAHLADPGSFRASKHKESFIMDGSSIWRAGQVNSLWIARALAPLAKNPVENIVLTCIWCDGNDFRPWLDQRALGNTEPR